MKAPTTLTKLLLIAVVTGATTTGCATAGTISSRAVADRQTAVSIRNYKQTAIIIRNNNWSDVKVYLVDASGRIPVRLGTIMSMATLRIPLRGAVASQLNRQGSLRFQIKPLGNPRENYITHSVILAPGDVLHLTVASQLTLSTLVVGRR